jgi:hypothetical protein
MSSPSMRTEAAQPGGSAQGAIAGRAEPDPPPFTSRPAYIWSLTLRDLLLISLVAALCMLAKMVLRIPIHVPGHSGVLWVALFVICRGLVDKRGAGVLLGAVSGVLAQFMGFGDVGPLEWTKWLAAGVILEVFTIIIPGDLRSFPKAMIVGAALHLGKLAALTVAGIILQVPWALLFLGLGFSATTHVFFGAVGGILGALALRQLRKVPMLDARARGG